MKSKRILALSIILLILIFALLKTPLNSQAQNSDTNTLPSDLSLDLALAQQNPAPDQNQIVTNEIKQVTTVTTTGQTDTTVSQDVVAPQVKTENLGNTINPDQTTSEQVVEQPVQVPVDDNRTPMPTSSDTSITSPPISGDTTPTSAQDINSLPNTNNANSPSGTTDTPTPIETDTTTPTSGSSDNLVPGTNVVQPDDNAAPMPSPTTSDQQNIPPESQPAPTTPDSNSNTDNSTNSTDDSSNSTDTSNTNSSTDNQSVQGISTGPSLWDQIINFITGRK